MSGCYSGPAMEDSRRANDGSVGRGRPAETVAVVLDFLRPRTRPSLPDPERGTPLTQEQLNRMLAQNLSALRARARALTHRAGDADDLVQETIERALAARDRLRAETLRPWLLRVMRQRVIDGWRRTSHRSRLDFSQLDPDSFTPEDLAEPGHPPGSLEERFGWQLLSSQDIQEAIAQLSPAAREATQLLLIQGLTRQDVARRLGLATATVGSRLRRAREQLRRILLQKLDDDDAAPGPEDDFVEKELAKLERLASKTLTHAHAMGRGLKEISQQLGSAADDLARLSQGSAKTPPNPPLPAQVSLAQTADWLVARTQDGGNS